MTDVALAPLPSGNARLRGASRLISMLFGLLHGVVGRCLRALKTFGATVLIVFAQFLQFIFGQILKP